MHQAPRSGYIATVQIAGIPTYFHWSFPVFGCLIAAFLADWSTTTVLAAASGYVFLVLAHELGHALFARRAKVRVHGMVITGGGGFCYADMPYRAMDRLLLHAGGLIAQTIIFTLSIAYIAAFGNPQSKALSCYLFVFTLINAIIFIGNIIPYRSNDGAMILRTINEIRNRA